MKLNHKRSENGVISRKPIYTKCCQCLNEAYSADVRLLKEMIITHAEVRHVGEERDDNG